MTKLREVWADTMVELGLDDPNLVVLVGDISHGILQPFAKKFPDRYLNVGICEPTIVGMAAGLAHAGLNPFFHTIAPFIAERAYEQLKLDFGYQKLSGNMVSVGGSFDYSQLGCSHHSYSDVGMVSQIEGARVFLPSSPIELRALLSHEYKKPGLKYFRLTENAHGHSFTEAEVLPGKALVPRVGNDITIVALGPTLQQALEAADALKPDIAAEVVYIHSFSPFDYETVRRSVEKTSAVVTVEELYQSGGLFHKVLEASVGLALKDAKRIAVEGFVRGYGSHTDLLERVGINAQNISRLVREILIQDSELA